MGGGGGVNGVVGRNASGGSTNHALHRVAMAAAAGIKLTWDDLSDRSDVVPLVARIYPNGLADVNHFHAAGGMGFLISQLLDGGLLHDDVMTVWGQGLGNYRQEPRLTGDGGVVWQPAARSEEHTSELQSLMRISYAVFCLKKKKQSKYII